MEHKQLKSVNLSGLITFSYVYFFLFRYIGDSIIRFVRAVEALKDKLSFMVTSSISESCNIQKRLVLRLNRQLFYRLSISTMNSKSRITCCEVTLSVASFLLLFGSSFSSYDA